MPPINMEGGGATSVVTRIQKHANTYRQALKSLNSEIIECSKIIGQKQYTKKESE